VIRFAAGADVLVHEATHHGMLLYGAQEMDRLGLTRWANFTREMLVNNADPIEAAETAKAAGVGMLLLTRLSPPPDDFIMRWMFLDGARAVFPRVTLGEDGMRLYFEPRP
jgi:ribonuclease Z